MRHAEVEEQYIGKYNGHIDIGLSQNGSLQAEKLGKELQQFSFDSIYCSDLLRAKQTLESFKIDSQPIYSKQLREKSWGKHEGMSYDEVCLVENIEYENFSQWINALDGEDIQTYIEGVESYFNNVLLKDIGKNILVVTHSGFIKTLLSIIKKLPLEEVFYTNLNYSSYIIFDKEKNDILKT